MAEYADIFVFVLSSFVAFFGFVFYRLGKERIGLVMGSLGSIFVVFSVQYMLHDGVDESSRLEDAYVAYMAYDDGVLDEREVKVFERFGKREGEDVQSILDKMPVQGSKMEKSVVSGYEIPDEVLVEYEGLVNRVIDSGDSTGEKLAFKKEVLIERQADLVTIWYDEKLDDNEKMLLEFAGDVTGTPMTRVIDSLERGEIKQNVAFLETLYMNLSGKSSKFNFGNDPLSKDGSGLYKVTD